MGRTNFVEEIDQIMLEMVKSIISFKMWWCKISWAVAAVVAECPNNEQNKNTQFFSAMNKFMIIKNKDFVA